jgi:hypothetical protein
VVLLWFFAAFKILKSFYFDSSRYVFGAGFGNNFFSAVEEGCDFDARLELGPALSNLDV